jgi:hypothetical protein
MPTEKKQWPYFEIWLAIALFFISVGWEMSGFQPHIIWACVLWALSVLLLAHALWRLTHFHPYVKAATVTIPSLLIVIFLWRPVLTQYKIQSVPKVDPLCNRADSIVLWLAYKARYLDQDERKIYPLHDPQMLINLTHGYEMAFKGKSGEMEELSAEMNAELGKTGRSHALDADDLADVWFGVETLSHTAEYFTNLSHEMGCPATTMEQWNLPLRPQP